MKTIGLIFGGRSSEYEVSLESAYSVLEAIDYKKYNIKKIGITREGRWFLFQGDNKAILDDTWIESSLEISPLLGNETKGFRMLFNDQFIEIDLLMPIMHGEYVEDGSIQGLFRLMDIDYLGCDVLSSSIGFNKALTHRLVKSIGIKVAPSIQFTNKVDLNLLDAFLKEQAYPYFVKPLRAGSSKGISKVNNYSDFEKAFIEAFKFDNIITIEKAISGFEVGCGILEYKGDLIVGSVDEIELSQGFFDYKEKYNLISSKIHMPARIDQAYFRKIQDYSKEIFKLLECKGLARVDFFLDDQGNIVFNEINTLPGFTSHSRYPSMMKEIGIDYPSLIDRLIENALFKPEEA